MYKVKNGLFTVTKIKQIADLCSIYKLKSFLSDAISVLWKWERWKLTLDDTYVV
jgi:hypothetical protein